MTKAEQPARWVVAGLAALSLCLSAEAAKPNVVFYLVDDLGYGDVGSFGSTFLDPPHIDAICEQALLKELKVW